MTWSNMGHLGSPASRASFHGFTPYKGKDVSGEYVQVEIPEMGTVWARLEIETDPKILEYVDAKQVVVLGHGNQPFIPWETLSVEARQLLATRSSRRRIQ